MGIKLGDLVRDRLTGFTGIAIGRTDWLYGCSRIGIEPKELDKEGKPREASWFDEQRVEVVERRAVDVSPDSKATTGGPFDAPARTSRAP